MFIFNSTLTVFLEIVFVAIPFFYALRHTRWYPTISRALSALLSSAARPSHRHTRVVHAKTASSSSSISWLESPFAEESKMEDEQDLPDSLDLTSDVINGDLMPTMSYRSKRSLGVL